MTVAVSHGRAGTTRDGRPVERWLLSDGVLRLAVLDLGGVLESLEAPDRDGVRRPVVLGLQDVAAYVEPDQPCLGALIGRYANRIAGAWFELDGVRHTLLANEGTSCLHGGPDGFHRRTWSVTEYGDDRGDGIRLTLTSPDGDQGFPGRLDVTMDYLLRPGAGEVLLRWSATTDAPTVLTLTHHAYLDLSGRDGAGTVDDHELSVPAGRTVETDDAGLPTGVLAAVDGTRRDLRAATRLADAGVLDDCYVLEAYDGAQAALRPAAHLRDPGSGRTLDVLTTEPGVQVYTADKLDGSFTGRGGRPLTARAAVCLETQHLPDSPHQPAFPSTVLRPGRLWTSETLWRFGR